jgi:hypothetical protein
MAKWMKWNIFLIKKFTSPYKKKIHHLILIFWGLSFHRKEGTTSNYHHCCTKAKISKTNDSGVKEQNSNLKLETKRENLLDIISVKIIPRLAAINAGSLGIFVYRLG